MLWWNRVVLIILGVTLVVTPVGISPLGKEIYFSNWLAAGSKGLPLTELHDTVSNNESSINSAGLEHAERVGALLTQVFHYGLRPSTA